MPIEEEEEEEEEEEDGEEEEEEEVLCSTNANYGIGSVSLNQQEKTN